ncbi:MAG: hypothetical protein WA830_02150 [Candidatus Sulfotelmatobacter sp.]
MTFRRFLEIFRMSALALVVAVALGQVVHGQAPLDHALLASGPLPEAPTPSVEAAPPVVVTPSLVGSEHQFWDKQNRVLFMAAAAMNGADFVVTRANLQSGGQELNPVVRGFGRSTAGLAVNFVGETAGVIGLSYFFHKTGHHKLERAVSFINIGGSAGAVGYGLAHR